MKMGFLIDFGIFLCPSSKRTAECALRSRAFCHHYSAYLVCMLGIIILGCVGDRSNSP